MPRQARDRGEFNSYHVILRGNERKNIFITDEDRIRFLDIMARMKEKYNFLVYAYCLMDNHIHLVINDNGNDISKIMKSISISYVGYFNRINKRCGHLFQDRFRSEIIKDDIYLLQVSKYIHNNPIKAGIVRKAEEYQWSSFNIYTGSCKDVRGLVEKNKILGIISNNSLEAVKAYIKYNIEEEIIQVIDIEDDVIVVSKENTYFIGSVAEAREKVMLFAEEKGISPANVMLDRALRNELMVEIRKNSSLSLKQIGSIFGGLSESRVSRILKKAGN